jgi:hypothetical protein
MSLPSSILNLFSDTYDGLPAARLRSASEAHNLEAALRHASHSYKTKINKTRKYGREFIVMLVNEHGA